MGKRARRVSGSHTVTLPVTEVAATPGLAGVPVISGTVGESPFSVVAHLAGRTLIVDIDGRRFVFSPDDLVFAIHAQLVEGQGSGRPSISSMPGGSRRGGGPGGPAESGGSSIQRRPS